MVGETWVTSHIAIFFPKLGQEFTILVKLHDATVTVSVGYEKFSRFGDGNVLRFAEAVIGGPWHEPVPQGQGRRRPPP